MKDLQAREMYILLSKGFDFALDLGWTKRVALNASVFAKKVLCFWSPWL